MNKQHGAETRCFCGPNQLISFRKCEHLSWL